MRTFSPATDLNTRQLVWAYLKNGSPVCAKGEPGILTAVEIAGFYFKKYGEPLKPLAVWYNTGGVRTDSSSLPPPTTMKTFLTAEEILQLVTTGIVELTDDLMIRMTESYEDSEWYNDPNNVMSKHHY